jgi:hypothetical protein
MARRTTVSLRSRGWSLNLPGHPLHRRRALMTEMPNGRPEWPIEIKTVPETITAQA